MREEEEEEEAFFSPLSLLFFTFFDFFCLSISLHTTHDSSCVTTNNEPTPRERDLEELK